MEEIIKKIINVFSYLNKLNVKKLKGKSGIVKNLMQNEKG